MQGRTGQLLRNAAVESVAQERAADGSEVDPYLVRPPRLRHKAQQGKAVSSGESLVAREAGRAVRAGAEALFLAAAAYGQVYDARSRLRDAGAYGQVFPTQARSVQQAAKPLVHVAGLGGAHDARRASVQPVHGVEGRGGAEVGGDGGADCGLAVLRAPVDGHVRGLIYYEYVLVLPEHLKAGAAGRIYATTDKARGALKSLADSEGWETFVVPDDVGGRYSVLTAVGLLPIAVAGVDITALMQGAAEMMETCTEASFRCPAWRYAAIRYELYRAGRSIELLACYDPAFRFMAEWWKQLFGESEGKEGKGLFPASVEFTADLHSMGQYIQEGKRLMFETVVRLGPSDRQLTVPADEADGDGLNFLAGKSLDFIRDRAMEGTLLAHTEGGVPNLIVETSGRTPADLGQLIYFFEYACGLSGYLLDVNPFDQPGVEAYKKNMFALLGKPGYEDRRAQLESKLEG